MDHNDNKMVTTWQTGTRGGPTVVVIVVVMQLGQSQRGGESNNNNYDDNNGDINGKEGAAAGLRATMPTGTSTATKLTKKTTMVARRNFCILRGGGGKGCTHHCLKGLQCSSSSFCQCVCSSLSSMSPPSLRQLEKIAVMIVSMLMHRLEISVMFCMDLIQAIALFPFVLWESVKSIIFLDVAFISLISSWLIRHLFLWGRKMDGLTEFASSSRLVTFSVAKFP